MEEKDLEQVVLLGLEYEYIEKEKAAERKALTRKNGIKPKEAKYSQTTQGQTRDIVAKKLGISGKHWERMKFIYLNKDQCKDQEYEEWRESKLSTSKLYTKLKNKQDVATDIEKILKALWKLDINTPGSTKRIHDDLRYTLYNYPRVEEKVLSSINEIKQVYDEYADVNHEMLMDIIDDVEKLKRKISCK